MRTRACCKSVLLPLTFSLATILICGCEPPTPVAPWPTHDRVIRAQPETPHKQCCHPKIIAFGADWCPACQAGQPKLDALERADVEVERVNIDQHPDLAIKWSITSIPVYFVIRCGHETVRTQDIDEVERLVSEVSL